MCGGVSSFRFFHANWQLLKRDSYFQRLRDVNIVIRQRPCGRARAAQHLWPRGPNVNEALQLHVITKIVDACFEDRLCRRSAVTLIYIMSLWTNMKPTGVELLARNHAWERWKRLPSTVELCARYLLSSTWLLWQFVNQRYGALPPPSGMECGPGNARAWSARPRARPGDRSRPRVPNAQSIQQPYLSKSSVDVLLF